MRAPLPEGERNAGDGARAPVDGRGVDGRRAGDGRVGDGRDDGGERELMADLRHRLRAVCGDWSDAEFEALVRRIAPQKLRWGEWPARH